MKYIELNKEEKELLKNFESGDFESVKDLKKEVGRYQGFAKNTLNKTRNINIRLSDRDIQKIKAIAAQKGLPYQTMISSLLHQYSQSS